MMLSVLRFPVPNFVCKTFASCVLVMDLFFTPLYICLMAFNMLSLSGIGSVSGTSSVSIIANVTALFTFCSSLASFPLSINRQRMVDAVVKSWDTVGFMVVCYLKIGFFTVRLLEWQVFSHVIRCRYVYVLIVVFRTLYCAGFIKYSFFECNIYEVNALAVACQPLLH